MPGRIGKMKGMVYQFEPRESEKWHDCQDESEC